MPLRLRHDLTTAGHDAPPASALKQNSPNETWQSDFIHWKLSDGTGVEILTFLDDYSRLALSVTAYRVVTASPTY